MYYTHAQVCNELLTYSASIVIETIWWVMIISCLDMYVYNDDIYDNVQDNDTVFFYLSQ